MPVSRVRRSALALALLLGLTTAAGAADLFSPTLTAQEGQRLTCTLTNVSTTAAVGFDFVGIVGPDGNGLSSTTTCNPQVGSLGVQQTCTTTTNVADEGHCWIRVSNTKVRAALAVVDATTGEVRAALAAE